jgi:O-acetyl-ADP-ribose deacetylase (regulator of RNase III)
LITFALPRLSIEILDGELAAQPVAAIVNAANNAFWMGSGVPGAIKARGGRVIEEEAVAQGPVEPGQCVMTSGGRLAARHVIHAAVMGQDLETSAVLIETATRGALALAQAWRLEAVAFPALGTGVGGFPLDQCARIMIAAVAAHASAPTSIRTVRFVLYGRQAYDAFVAVAPLALQEWSHQP